MAKGKKLFTVQVGRGWSKVIGKKGLIYMELDLKSVEKVLNQAARRGEQKYHAAMGAIYEEFNEILGESQEICPYKTGALRRSGVVLLPDKDQGPIISYGGGPEDVDYASDVHEAVGRVFAHEGTIAKFLEIPFKAHIKGMGQRVKKAAERA